MDFILEDLAIDDVEILVTKTDPYISLIHEIANSLDIPVAFSGASPLSTLVPARGDFLVEGKFLFEIGGKAKKRTHIKEAQNS